MINDTSLSYINFGYQEQPSTSYIGISNENNLDPLQNLKDRTLSNQKMNFLSMDYSLPEHKDNTTNQSYNDQIEQNEILMQRKHDFIKRKYN